MSRLGAKVRETRIMKGMTQQRFAEKGNLSHSLIVALESGRRRYVGPPDVKRLAMSLDISENELWELIPGGKSDKRYTSIV